MTAHYFFVMMNAWPVPSTIIVRPTGHSPCSTLYIDVSPSIRTAQTFVFKYSIMTSGAVTVYGSSSLP